MSSSSKSLDLATTSSIMIMDPHNLHYTNWNNNKPNDLMIITTTQDHHHHHHQYPNFLHDLLIDHPPPPQETLIPFQSPPTTNLFSGQDQDQDQEDQDQEEEEDEDEEMDAMKEMQYMIAAMQPIDIDPATVPKPNRRNVRISDDPQTVVARRRRERISEKIRILKRIVPGGAKMDTASMLDEAIRYAKFLKRQVKLLQSHPHQQSQLIGAPMADPTSLYYYQNPQP